MRRRELLTTAIATAAAAALPKLANAATNTTQEGPAMTTPTNRPASGYAPVNGVEVYYEIHGSGKPLVLLHGGFGSIEMFGPVLAALAEKRQVIGVDLQGHGRTLPFDRPMTFANMATDVAELIKWLSYEKADIMGYSMGAATAIRTAIDHPEVVDRLISSSTAYAFAGWHDYNQQGMKGMAAAPDQAIEPMKQTPMYQAYVQLMPDAEKNWAKTITQTAAMVGQDYDWSGEIGRIAAPTLLVYGDWDAVRTSHVASFFELLGGGRQDANWDGSGMNRNRLAIIPGITHYTMFMDPRLLPPHWASWTRKMDQNVVTVPAGVDYFTIDREFAAPRALIWRCYTQPVHLARFWGPRDARTAATVDLRVGGVWRTEWTYESGSTYGYASVYLEIAEPERIHYRDCPKDWVGGLDGLPPAELTSTISLTETDGRTNVHVHVRAASVALRDQTVARGFAGMVSMGHDRLAEYLPTLTAGAV